ncbi:MAG: OmpH family outer membrane protein [Proteobacteria bacterium]|nr:OmpH family outer membrane protein [Pseudomonadota bacterium]
MVLARAFKCGVVSTVLLWGIAFSSLAYAQSKEGNIIAVLDIPRIMSDARVIDDINSQLKTLEENFENDVKKREEDLREERVQLGKQKVILAPNVFAQKQEKLAQKVGKFRQEVRDQARQLQRSKLVALDEVKKALIPIVQEVSSRKGANMVLETADLLFADKSLDLTAEILEELNKTFTKVTVKVVPLKKS